MALIGEITGSGGLTASGSVFISGSLQLSQETGDPTILENMGGAIYIKEDTDGADQFYFRNSAGTVTQLGSAGAATDNTWTGVNTFDGEITASSGLLFADDKKLYFGTDKDWSIEYDEDGDDDLVMTGDKLSIESSTAGRPRVTIKNTTNDANSATLRFVKDKGAAGAADDNVGVIEFYGDDANQDQVLFGRIRTRVAVHTNGQEGGKMHLSVASHDGELNHGLVITDGNAEDEVDVTVGNGSASRTTIAGDMTITTIANPGSDVDKFLVSNSGVVGFRTGAEVASDIGATSTTATNNFTGDVTASQGLTIPDDTLLRFGNASGGDATIEYDEDGTDELRFAGAAVTFEQAASFDANVTLGNAASDVTTVTGQLTASSGIAITGSIHIGASLTNAGGDTDKFLCVDPDGELRFRTGAEVASDIDAVAADANITFTGKLTASNGLLISNLENPGSDVDKFLVSNSGLIQFRTGAEVASDIGATSTTATNNFTGDMTASQGLAIPDDTLLRFGNASGGDATIEYDEDGTDELRFAGAAVTFEQAASFDANVTLGNAATDVTTVTGQLTASNGVAITGSIHIGASLTNAGADTDKFLCVDPDGELRFRTGAEVASDIDATATTATNNFTGDVTASQGLTIPDDTLLRFGNASGGDATIEYDENGTDELRFAGAAVTFEQAVSFDGNVTLGLSNADAVTVPAQLTASEGLLIKDDRKLYFGDGQDWSIEYDEDGDDDLKMTGTTLTVASDTVTFTSEASTDPLVIIKNYTNDENGARLRFVKDKGAAGAANDVAGVIEFYADDASQDQVLFSEIKSQVAVHTNGQEGGKLSLSVASHDGESQPGLVITDGSAEDEVDVTVGNGSASRTTISGDMTITTIANPGSDVDKFLVSNSGVVGFRTGAEVASDIGATSTTATNNFTGDLTASQGLSIPDDTLLRFGNASGGDATFEYDEDGTDTLLYAGASLRISDDVKLEFGSGGDATIEYDENGTDELRFAGAAVTFEQAASFDGNMTLGLSNADVVTVPAQLTASEGILVKDDRFLYFGDGQDVSFEYDEDGNDTLIISGNPVLISSQLTASAGIAITGSFHIGASLVNAGGDTDKFLCVDPDGEVRFRTGAEVASDIGALAADANITFSGKVTASNGLVVATSDDGLMMADGIPINIGASGDLTIYHDGTDSTILNSTGDLKIRSTVNSADAIFIEVDGGTSETIMIHSDQGTAAAAATETDASIQLHSDVGGIGLHSGLNGDNAIRIEANGGANETIVIHANQGTGEDHANSSILLLSDVGGIGLTATGLTGVMTDGNSDAAVQLTALAGGIGLRTTSNLAGAIQIEADGGTSETIIIKSDQGTGKWVKGTNNSSIQILSDVGGVSIDTPALNHVHSFSTDALTNAFGADGDTCGTIIKYSPGADDTLTVGQLYFFHTDGTWNQCDADAVATGGSQLLGIGLGNARTVGVLIKGFVRIPSTEILNVPGSNASPGLPVYMSTTAGHLDFTAPSGNGDIVRIVGYAIQDDTDVLIYFDPDPTYVEVSA